MTVFGHVENDSVARHIYPHLIDTAMWISAQVEEYYGWIVNDTYVLCHKTSRHHFSRWLCLRRKVGCNTRATHAQPLDPICHY